MNTLWKYKAVCTLLLALMTASPAAAEEKVWHLVAKDNFGKDRERVLKATASWTCDEKAVPQSVCAKDAPARSMIFGARELQLEYRGLLEEADYRLRLTFLSDKPGRAMAVLIDGKLVRERFNLPARKIHRLDIRIARSMLSDGRILVTLENRRGPNVILSHAELLSSHGRLQADLHAEYFANGGFISGKLSDRNALDKKVPAGTQITAELQGKSIRALTDKEGNFTLNLPSAWLADEQQKITLSTAGGSNKISFRAGQTQREKLPQSRARARLSGSF